MESEICPVTPKDAGDSRQIQASDLLGAIVKIGETFTCDPNRGWIVMRSKGHSRPRPYFSGDQVSLGENRSTRNCIEKVAPLLRYGQEFTPRRKNLSNIQIHPWGRVHPTCNRTVKSFLMLRRFNSEHRAFGHSNHMLRSAPHKQMAQAGPAVSTHYDQINGLFFCQLHDFFTRNAFS